MLELILGRAGTGKTTLLRKRLAESTAPKTILIVPEQYTFESEHALLMEYGADREPCAGVQLYAPCAGGIFAVRRRCRQAFNGRRQAHFDDLGARKLRRPTHTV